MPHILSGLFRHPLTLMIVAVGLWMLYPPLVNELVDQLRTFYVAAVAHTLAALSMLAFTAVVLLRQDRRLVPKLLERSNLRRVSLPTLMSGFLICANHLLLYFALEVTTDFDVIAILVFETWPILFFYIDSALRRDRRKTSINDYIFSGAAFAGFLVLTTPNFDVADWLLLDSPMLNTMGLAGLGGLAMAVNCFFRMKCMDAWQALSEDRSLGLDGFRLGLLTETGVRTVAAPLLIAAFLLSGDPVPEATTSDLLLLGFVGFVILGVGSLLYDLSVFNAKNASISALWYLMPVGAVIILALMQGRFLNQYEAIASVLIVSSNIFLGLRYPLRSSLLVLFVSVCLIGIWLLFAPLFTIDHYYDLLAVSTVFFVLLASFALERTTSLNRERESLLGEFHEQLLAVLERPSVTADGGDRETFLGHIRQYALWHMHSFLRAFTSLSALADTQGHVEKLKYALVPLVRRDEAARADLLALFRVGDKLMTLESDRIPAEEMIILILLGATNVFFSLVFRPDSLSAGIFALIVATSMIYLLLIIHERDKYAQVRHDHGQACSHMLDYLNSHAGHNADSSQVRAVQDRIQTVIDERAQSLHSRGRSYWIFGIFVFLFSGFGYGLMYDSLNRPPTAENSPLMASTDDPTQAVHVVAPNWPSARLKAHILAGIIDQHTEFRARIASPVPTEQAFVAMDDEDGGISIHPEIWEENNHDLIRRYVRAFGSVSLGQQSVTGKQGLCYTAGNAGDGKPLSLEELNSPTMASRFDMTGDGKGDIWIGTDGWTSVDIERRRLQAYGLDRFYQFHVFDRDVQQMLLDRNSRQGVPTLFFCYHPDALFTNPDIRLVDEPAHDKALWKKIISARQSELPDQGTSWPEVRLRVAYRSDLAETSRELATLLDNFVISNPELLDMLRELQGGTPVEVVAATWIQTHEDTVLTWLTGFRL
ncbi:glycine betaine ABC transporter substrate-binding protein [Marinobacter sp. M1N3S26]|uniref:glycine betaine ABC transporter substrate-binding protein n=1 Tax=Marinobacter sp. M1N3S26 TaxID=3382299 RepID=UPI00387AED63